ncbi:MAG: 3-dehydroquinate synthase [Hyphomonadaceae bacterium]|nr:3-dehydroquinate synthase [Clostridia bacterium]
MNTMRIDLGHASYDLVIERGCLRTLGEMISGIYAGDKICIVSDTQVAVKYGEQVVTALENKRYHVKLLTFKAGEESKTAETLLGLCGQMIDFGLNRGHLIIALGGGVVGDVTGFAASILLRGIPYVQIPTTLLAQVDSSIGGKVAVDMPQGKNLIGSFYHPKLVVIDPDVLATLSPAFLSDGMAEVIKYGAILDETLFEWLMHEVDLDNFSQHAEKIIERCCALKKNIVEQDEMDTGLRMILNFGHTVGHAIEKCYNYTTYSHGQAVAIGMVVAARLGEVMGITPKGCADKISKVCERFNLSTVFPDLAKADILNAMGGDKKNIGKMFNFILLKDIGQAVITPFTMAELEEKLAL